MLFRSLILAKITKKWSVFRDAQLIKLCKSTSQRPNVCLFLCTNGGNPDTAYRIARFLQKKYQKFSVYIGGICKSAGTLLTIGAHELIMSDYAELGPLDIQLGKKDELWETDSGLTVLNAIDALEEKSYELLEKYFVNLKTRTAVRITLKTAMELATKLSVGIMSPIIEQIDPLQVGEVSRAMNIGKEYGKRLSEASKNLKTSQFPSEDALTQLIYSYPSHSFVIDREEAKRLFLNVREPDNIENSLIEELENFICEPRYKNDDLIIVNLTEIVSNAELTEENNEIER